MRSLPTIDGVTNLRCMTVGLTPEQEAACRAAIMPVPVVRLQTVAEACSSMSTVLPLVVIVDEEISQKDRDALAEFTTACGAELVTLERNLSGNTHGKRLFDAIIVAERRRMGAKAKSE